MARTIEERAVEALIQIEKRSEYDGIVFSDKVSLLRDYFADVVETDPRVLALVAAARSALNAIDLREYPSTVAQIDAALKSFEK